MCQKSSLDANEYNTNPADMNFEKLEKLLRENAQYLSIVRIHGGEPTYYKHFIKLINLLDELKLKYTLITNGSLLSKEILEKLLKNCLLITISIDSVDENMYNYIRPNGSIKTITQNITTLNQFKKQKSKNTPFINIAATMFTFNIKGLSDLVKYCASNRIQSMSISEGAYYNTPKIKESDFIKNDIELVKKSVNKAQETADKLGIVLRFNSDILYWNKKENQLISNRNKITNCFNFYFSAIITPQFDLQLCPLSYSITDIRINSLSDVWSSKNGVIASSRKLINNNNKFPDTCRYCIDYNASLANDNKEYSYVDYQKKNKYWKNPI